MGVLEKHFHHLKGVTIGMELTATEYNALVRLHEKLCKVSSYSKTPPGDLRTFFIDLEEYLESLSEEKLRNMQNAIDFAYNHVIATSRAGDKWLLGEAEKILRPFRSKRPWRREEE